MATAGSGYGQSTGKSEPIWTSSHPSYAAIDKHALQAPADAEETLAKLAAYLTRAAGQERCRESPRLLSLDHRSRYL